MKCGELNANIACIRNEEEERIVMDMNDYTMVGLYQCDRSDEVGVGARGSVFVGSQRGAWRRAQTRTRTFARSRGEGGRGSGAQNRNG